MVGSPKLTEFFTKNGSLVSYKKDEVIIPLGKPASHGFYIVRGFVKSYDITKLGQLNLLMIYKSGEMFPLPETLRDELDGSMEIVYEALTDVTLRRVSMASILAAARNDSEIGQAIIEQLMNIFDIYRQRIQNLGLRTSREKLVFRLMFLCGRFGIKRNGDYIIDAPVTHQLLADSTALTRETVSREMRKLAKLGYIEQQSHLIVIKDHQRMSKELN